MGRERGHVLAVAAADPVMSVVAPIALAAAAGTALVVDLGQTLGREGKRTLADVAAEGPTSSEAMPARRGVAVIRAGGLDPVETARLVDRLATGWPAIVVRLTGGEWPGPVAPVHPLYPGVLAPRDRRPAVWQRVRGGSDAPGPGPVIPPAGAANVRRILAGGVPLPGRWLRSWQVVWRLPWA
ncbi:MAG TPA: hypothetical protein VF246_09860 [Acidimicrobiia bacterium]